jgi:hypothetical protein
MTLNCIRFISVCLRENLRADVDLTLCVSLFAELGSIKYVISTDTNRGVTHVESVVLPARATVVEGR